MSSKVQKNNWNHSARWISVQKWKFDCIFTRFSKMMRMRNSFELVKTCVLWVHQKIDVNISKDVWKRRGPQISWSILARTYDKNIVFYWKSIGLYEKLIFWAPTGTESHEERYWLGEIAVGKIYIFLAEHKWHVNCKGARWVGIIRIGWTNSRHARRHSGAGAPQGSVIRK